MTLRASTLTAAQVVAAQACAVDPDRLEPTVLELVGRAVIDTVGVGLAGRIEEASRMSLRYARLENPAEGSALCWGSAERLPMECAALCNGVAAHVLDYDDVTSPMRGHPSVAMLPALIALGEVIDSSGRELAAAYSVGFDAVCRISRAMALRHYARGWHSTSTIGGLGCAVACAKLLGLDEVRTTHAIGLAVAQAAGSRANFGTSAKSFQAGHANALGLRAALLAREGFDAAPDILEGAYGYAALYGHGEPLAQALRSAAGGPSELEREGIEVKKYPLCYATHRTLDGLLALRAEHGLTLDQVAAVQVRTSAGALAPLIHARPQTGLEGKFSMQYAVAAALSDGTVTLASFTDEAVRRPDLQGFFPAVCVEEAPGELLPRWADVDLTLRDGRRLRRRIDNLHGSARSPLSADELRDKLRDCIAYGSPGIDADTFFDQAMDLRATSVRVLTACLRPADPFQHDQETPAT